MKHFFTAIVLILTILISNNALSSIMNEKVTNTNPSQPLKFDFKNIKINDDFKFVPNNDDKKNTTQGYTKIVDLGTTPYYYCYSEDANPLYYEPISKTLSFLEVRYNSGTPLVGQLVIRNSVNGANFGAPISIFQKSGQLPLLPSISVINPNKATNTSGLKYFIFAPYFQYTGSGYQVQNSRFFVSASGKLDTFNIRMPEANPDRAYWFDAKTTAFGDGNNQYGYIASMLSVDPGYQYGWYGLGIYDMSENSAFSYIPDNWSLSKFKPSTQTTSTFNNRMYIDNDNKGSVYVAVANIFASAGEDFRTLGVSKSKDNGETWSDWDLFPKSEFLSFCNTIQSPDPSKCYIYPYAQDAFLVTGEDSYTYMCTTIIYAGVNQQGQDDYDVVIAEISKENNSWSMKPISGSSGIFSTLIGNMDRTNTTVRDSLFRSAKDWEYQLAKTSDGKYIVAKWLDYTKWISFSSTTLGSGIKFDSALVNDVFVSYRLIGDNQWSKPVNVTDDDLYNKLTYIPKTVPSLNNIQMVSMRTEHNSTNPTHPYEKYPDPLFQRIIDYNNAAYLTTFSADGGTVNVIENTTEESLKINSITPNPATNLADINFTVTNPSNIKLEIYNNMGQLVKVLLSGRVNLGSQAINANVNDLSTGTYYLKLSDGKNSVTKNLLIIK